MTNFVSLESHEQQRLGCLEADIVLVQFWDWRLRREEFGDFIVKILEM